MKTRSKILASGAMVMGLLLTSFTVSLAQSDENPAWQTSKDVQKVANKQLFNDDNLRNSHIRAESVLPTNVISKGVHQKKSDDKPEGNVASAYPTWIISKDVHKKGRKN